MMMYYVISGIFMLLGSFVSNRLKSKFKQYSELLLPNGMSGKEIAEQMLIDNGIQDVQVVSVNGFLSDHYNPANKTVNLSPDVYNGRSVSAAAVAAHECGHALQHAQAYRWLQFRSRMVPAVQISSRLSQIVIMIGLGLSIGAHNPMVLGIGIILFAVTTLFSVVTLPVEFDASNRALAWLRTKNYTPGPLGDASADALKWAARTYIVGALASIAQLMYFVMIFMNRR